MALSQKSLVRRVWFEARRSDDAGFLAFEEGCEGAQLRARTDLMITRDRGAVTSSIRSASP
jgi:hypothetical protein